MINLHDERSWCKMFVRLAPKHSPGNDSSRPLYATGFRVLELENYWVPFRTFFGGCLMFFRRFAACFRSRPKSLNQNALKSSMTSQGENAHRTSESDDRTVWVGLAFESCNLPLTSCKLQLASCNLPLLITCLLAIVRPTLCRTIFSAFLASRKLRRQRSPVI